MTDLMCPAGHPTPGPRHSGGLCLGCRAVMHQDLIEIDQVYAALLIPASAGMTQRVGGSPERPAPMSDSRADARDLIRRVLSNWAGLVCDERQVTPPGLSVPRLTRFLGTHLEWLGGHPAAVDLSLELHDLAWGAPRSAAYPQNAVKRIERLVTCPQRLDGGQACGMLATAVLRREDSLRASEIRCPAGHVVEAGPWLRVIPADIEGAVTTEGAALLLYGDANMSDLIRQAVSRGKLERGIDGLIDLGAVKALYAEWWGSVGRG